MATIVWSPIARSTVVGGAPVDDDLVVRLRCPSLDELVGVEVGIVDPVAGERRRTFATELLAVGAGELPEALDLWGHDGDAVDPGELGRQRTVDEILGELAVGRERVGAAHHGVGRAERRLEQRVEVGAEGVAEQHRAGEQGDAEAHRERRAEEAAHVGAHRRNDETQHGSGSDRLEGVEDPLGCGVFHRADGAPVGEEDD